MRNETTLTVLRLHHSYIEEFLNGSFYAWYSYLDKTQEYAYGFCLTEFAACKEAYLVEQYMLTNSWDHDLSWLTPEAYHFSAPKTRVNSKARLVWPKP
jgi:hypothetical protein